MEIKIWQSLLIAVWVALVQSRCLFGLATLTLRFSAMMTGLVCGVILGDIPNAMMITSVIQLIYMGAFAPGGQMPQEPCVSAAVAVPIALLGGLSPESAVAIAVPCGLLGNYLYQVRFLLNTFIMKLTDEGAKEVNDKKLFFSIIILPILAAFLLYVPFMFITLQFGAPLIANFVQKNASGWFFRMLTVIGDGLPALGIAVTIYVIGKKDYLVFFLLAYFMAVILKPLNITMVTYAVIGTIISAIFVLVKKESQK